jgi:hypothetical protein
MKNPIEKLESPFLDGELELAVPAPNELGHGFARVLGESPFANYIAAVPETEPEQSTERIELYGEWPNEEHQSAHESSTSAEADWLNPIEENPSDNQSGEDGLLNSESDETEEDSLYETEASLEDQADIFMDEAEQSIECDDLIPQDEAYPLNHDGEQDSIDEELSEEEDQAGNKSTLSVTVILDQPGERDDRFELVSSSGRYRRTLGANDATPLVAGEMMLLFEVPDKGNYTLIHHRAKDGSQYTIFRNRRFQDMAGTHKPRERTPIYQQLYGQPDNAGTERDLIQASPVLVNLDVKDPEF